VPNLELLKGSKIMKDKLVKNGHKGIYYFIRKLCIGVAVSASLVAAIGFPTYVLIKNYAEKQTLADDSNSEEPNEKINLLAYND